ncbi:UNVERIFIED_CONTAM: hypothetical protein H355_012305 [Colinus virginianus]|nr:hypothetical protein H355_012305 [Colinus virginianus]
MKANQYHLPFRKEVDYWERTLAQVSDTVEMLLQVQKQWIYLENVFKGSDDIRLILPQEATTFDEVHVGFAAVLIEIAKDNNILRACGKAELLHSLNGMNEKLEKMQKSLDDYLEKKRTADTESALRKIAKGNKNALRQLKKQQCKQLSKLIDLVKKPLSLTDQLKLVSLIVVEVHARDVQERMILSKCDNENSFAWKSQLRFVMREETMDFQGGQPLGSYMICQVLQTETVTPYGYEYQGNNKRLVVTPLTDKCFMTLTMALHLKLGGSLQGPAGTGKSSRAESGSKLLRPTCAGRGPHYHLLYSILVVRKTETVKDLGKNTAKFVLVFNCSDALDYISLGRIFSGLAQSGAWGSFDEFNRIEIEVLSVVAQQISVIQQALREIPAYEETSQVHKFLFEGHRVRLDPTCGIFITMNPGYAGRTELPDNLTSLFRPVAMMAPDLSLICEITLMAEGFEEAQFLARKVIILYQLMTQQLSKQDHYDFGLRAIRSVLSRAGNFRRSAPDSPEQEIMMQAILDLNLSKIVTDDLQLFEVLMRDVFPEADIGNTMEWTDGILAALMRSVCQDAKATLKWIVLDGPVDTLWIESMNSVLDDNKTLTLVNGDRIGVPPQVSLLFEVDNLYAASPATISRVGMIYMDRKELGSEPLVETWLQKTFENKDTRTFMARLTEKYVEKILAGDNWLAMTEKTFVFALVWSIGASVEAESRCIIDQCIRQSDHSFPPSRTVYDYFINSEKQEWKLWEDRLPSQYRDGADYLLKQIIERKLEKRVKNKYGPTGNKKLVCFIDDLNMPKRDTYGSQPPLELLRQLIDHGHWYGGLRRVRCKETTFLISDAEIVTETFMEDINNILSTGEIPNLFNSDELGFLCRDLQKAATEAGVSTSNTDAMHDFFLARVRENLHVVFCIRPVGQQLRNYCRNYPALINNTTIDWFFPWPEDALKEVAVTFLSDSSLEENSREIVAEVFARVHTLVLLQSEQFCREMKRKNCVTPTKFLELVEGYLRLFQEKTREVRELVHKLSVGLNKLVQTRAQVEVMGTELEAKKEVVARKQNECQELLVAIIEKRTVADEQKKQVEADSERIANEEEETKVLSEEARRDLAKAMPALEAAIDALDKLDKKSVAEVKAYTKPPDLVVKTMAAVMTVMEKTPSWAQAKVELNDPGFLTKVKNFDKDSISNSTLKKIEKYTKDSTFAPNSVLKVSRAAGALCMWVHAMQMYAEVYREVEPKRLRLKLAEEQLEKKQTDLLASKQRLRDIQNLLEGLKDQYNESIKTKDELNASAEELKLKMERAESLISGLAGERDRWEVSLATYTDELRCLPGDCLLAAAFMSYAGPFNVDDRTRLVSSCWIPLVDHFHLPHNPSFDFADFLANAVDVRQWNLQGLPTDRFSTENGVLVTKSIRWPLMIDPQNQGAKWIRNMEAANGLKVSTDRRPTNAQNPYGNERDNGILDPETKGYLRTIVQAVETGKPVLVERVQNDLDPSLHSLLCRSISEAKKTSSIKIGDAWVRYDPAFKLYLTTKIANPDFTPEVVSAVNLVNFTVKEDGLTAQLLGIVVMKEEPRLEEQKNELVVKLAEGRRRLQDLEDEILRLLTNSQGSLLDDVELVATLQESKSTAEEVTHQIEVSEQTLQKIDQARDAYKYDAADTRLRRFLSRSCLNVALCCGRR